ncbi:MAG: ABC transporter ATP-binding protein [Eubacteriales bacterium]
MKSSTKKQASAAYVFKFIYRYEPVYLFWSSLTIIINSALPILYVYAPKLILESLTKGKAFAEVVKIVLLYGGVLLSVNLCYAIFTSRSALAADRFAKKLKFEIGGITMSLQLSALERASTAETVNLAKNASEITETMSYLGGAASNVITIAGLGYLIARLDAVCLLSVLGVVALKSFFAFFQYRYTKKARLLASRNERVGNYLSGLAYFNHGAEKEIRVGNLQNWFMGKIKAYRKEMVTLQYRNFANNAGFEALISVAAALQSLLVLGVLTENYLSGEIGIADFTMIFAAVTSLTSALSSLSDQISRYSRQMTNISDFKKLSSLREDDQDGIAGDMTEIPPGEFGEIHFERVCFTYPGGDSPVLSDINIKIKKGEKLVIVEPNGAGKSTFIKLLCKFYKPTSGKITLNGIDIWSIPNSRYYPLISAVFQDFTNFAFTIGENIAFAENFDAGKASEVLRKLGMEGYADKTDIYISRNFSPGGIEPSGGEGQKLAVARAVYKDSPLVILDEPTASLDVRAESEIYENFFNLAKNKTTIFISHRLACSKSADNIAVFESGKIAEYGSHGELMARGELYSEMYKKQSKPYNSTKV